MTVDRFQVYDLVTQHLYTLRSDHHAEPTARLSPHSRDGNVPGALQHVLLTCFTAGSFTFLIPFPFLSIPTPLPPAAIRSCSVAMSLFLFHPVHLCLDSLVSEVTQCLSFSA